MMCHERLVRRWLSNSSRLISKTTRFGHCLIAADFDGDGYDDLAIGMPGEDLSGCDFVTCYEDVDAGAVRVLYGGSGSGLSGAGTQFWTQESSRTDLVEERDYFGFSLAAGDFNGDGYSDLAVTAWGEGVGGAVTGAGAVSIIGGSAARLSNRATAGQFWHQDKAGVSDIAESGDCFGCSLAAGDFNGDGYDDLAVGASGENLPPLDRGMDAGAVHVLYGSPHWLNLDSTIHQFWHQSVPDVQDRIEAYDNFGASLTVGDFNRDGFDDLAIGITGEDVDTLVQGTVSNAGAVAVLHGSAIGLSATVVPDQFWHQARTGVEDLPEESDNFGFSLAAGDFNGDGIDDLAAGVPQEDPSSINGTIVDAGAVHVTYGSLSGLNAMTILDQFWTQIIVLLPMPGG